ncbi:hypothetical protein HanPSC8_Chr11g0490681 [Helianthus annuus]|nr:hypothetical protein HanPSC8_Chr11g0490681 [Helianthus annuus]
MAVDNSSSSPSFRELDDVFLQSQARIWLGEVLRTRFDEQISIGDLLSDGEMLYVQKEDQWNLIVAGSSTGSKSDSSSSSSLFDPYQKPLEVIVIQTESLRTVKAGNGCENEGKIHFEYGFVLVFV